MVGKMVPPRATGRPATDTAPAGAGDLLTELRTAAAEAGKKDAALVVQARKLKYNVTDIDTLAADPAAAQAVLTWLKALPVAGGDN
jgi:hypothetical protein